MIIDIHGHLGNINFVPFWQADAIRLQEYLRDSGIDRICLSASRAIMYDIREGNQELASVLAEDQGRHFYGYAVVSPTFPDSQDDVALLASNPWFKGVKIHPDYHGYDLDIPSNYRFVEQVVSQVPTALFHVSCMPGTGFSQAATILRMAKDHPKTRFVLAHAAGMFQNGSYPFFPNLDKLERICEQGLPDNLWIDTAHYLLYAYPGTLQKMVRLAGASHVVFGTDAPLQGPMQMRFMAETVRALDVPEQDKDAILFKNAIRILDLDI